MVIRLYGKKAVKVSRHPVKFYDYRYCGSGDIMVLVCHEISQEHVTKGWSNIIDRSPS